MSGRYRDYSDLEPKLRYAMEHSMNEKAYPNVFSPDLNPDDFLLENNPNWRLTRCGKFVGREEDGVTPILQPRIVLEITSFMGICAGAMHYYGKIKADGWHFTEGSTGHYGYLGKCFNSWPREKQALCSSKYNIEIVKPLTEEDIKNNPDRYEGYCPGWPTNAFEDKDEIIKIAKKIVAARFPEGWGKMEIEDNS